MTMIEHAATFYGADGGQVVVGRQFQGGTLLTALGQDRFAEIPLHKHADPTSPVVAVPVGSKVGVFLRVLVNDGRWLVQCPSCHSAQFAAKTDHRFFCVECQNRANGGLWVAVEWPNNVDAIEALLELRSDVRTRNWRFGDDLAAENDQHGVV